MEEFGNFLHAAHEIPALWVVAIILLPALLFNLVFRKIAPERTKPFAPIFSVQAASLFWIMVALVTLHWLGVPLSAILRQPLVLAEIGVVLVSVLWFLVSPSLTPAILLLLYQIVECVYGFAHLGGLEEGVQTAVGEGVVIFRIVAALMMAFGIMMLTTHRSLGELLETKQE